MHRSPLLALVVTAATLGGFLFGFDTAVISGVIVLVKPQYQLSPMMEGWLVSSALLGCIGGVVLSGRMGDSLGRKKAMLVSAVLFAVSALGCAFAPDPMALVVFRLIGGLGIGVASVICPMYIAELAPPQVRGKLIAFYQLAITAGILAAYFSNALVQAGAGQAADGAAGWWPYLFRDESWRGMFAVGVLPALAFMGLIAGIPESPRWLALKGKNQAAAAVLARISGAGQAQAAMEEIRQSLQQRTAVRTRDLFTGAMRAPMWIGILLAALSQFSGINAIIYYGPAILEQAGFRLGEALGGQVTIGLVNTLFTLVAIYRIDRGGRKPLLLWGIGGAVISLLLAALLFALQVGNSWLVLIPVVLFIACFAFSFGPVTWVVIAEIFPTQVRSAAAAISTLSLWAANWMVGQFFPLLLRQGGPSATFLVFAACSAYAFYFTWKRIPETKGRSLEEIEGFWEKG